jgi:hypothetical protein
MEYSSPRIEALGSNNIKTEVTSSSGLFAFASTLVVFSEVVVIVL